MSGKRSAVKTNECESVTKIKKKQNLQPGTSPESKISALRHSTKRSRRSPYSGACKNFRYGLRTYKVNA